MCKDLRYQCDGEEGGVRGEEMDVEDVWMQGQRGTEGGEELTGQI